MGLESFGNNINTLDSTNPEGTDPKSQGDNHLRGMKSVLREQFKEADGTTPWSSSISVDPIDVQRGYIPIGGAILWTGAISAISSTGGSSGDSDVFALMNGTANSTGSGIDLTGQFIICADADSGGSYDVGSSGGSDTTSSSTTGATVDAHTLTIGEIPSHDHDYRRYNNLLDDVQGTVGAQNNLWQGTAVTGTTESTGGGGAHSHGLTDPGHTHTVLPPFYALAWIERLK